MASGAEKRRCRRFQVPNAHTKYRKTGLLVLVRGMSKAYPVINVSKGGLAFLCDEAIKEGTAVEVQLIAPGEEPLDLLGKTRWKGSPPGREDYMVGVRFLPFGSKDGNSSEALEVIRRLEDQYGNTEQSGQDSTDWKKMV